MADPAHPGEVLQKPQQDQMRQMPQGKQMPDQPQGIDPSGKPKRSLRIERREQRLAFVKQAAAPRRVRVVPKNEELRNSIRHPRLGGFRSSGSIEWPLDNWTKRRIKEGSVIVEHRKQEAVPPQHTTRQGARVLGSAGDKPRI